MTSQTTSREEVTRANQVYFDRISHTYEADPRQRYGLFAGNARRRYREFLAGSLDAIRRGVLVNVACGTGNMLDLEQELGLRGVGLDISMNMLKLARRHHGRLFAADFYAMPFRDGSVSCATGLALLHHVYDHAGFFAELHRVLMPGGLFYADYDPNYYAVTRIKTHPVLGPLWRRYERYSDGVREIDDTVDAETFALADYWAVKEPGLRREDLERAVRGAGFADVTVICHSDGPSLRAPRTGRLPHKVLEGMLRLVGERDYGHRAKNLAMIVRKAGA